MEPNTGSPGLGIDPITQYKLVVCIAALALAVPGIIIGLSVTDLVSTVTNKALSTAAETIETILLLLSVVSMCKMLSDRRSVTCDSRDDNSVNQVLLKIYPCGLRGFLGVVCVLCLASLVMPGFTLYAIGSCFSEIASFSTVLGFCMSILKLVFIVLQLLTIVKPADYGPRTVRTLLYTSIIVATNICLCVESVSTAAKQSILNSQQNTTGEAYYHAFCEKQAKPIGKAYEIIDRYMYSFIFLFCVYSIEILCVAWNRTSIRNRSIQERRDTIADKDSDHDFQTISERTPLMQQSGKPTKSRLKAVFCVNVCRYSYLPTLAVCVLLFVIHAIPSLKSSDALAWTISMYMNFMSGAAFLGYIKVWKVSFSKDNFLSKHIVLVFSGLVFLALTVVETVYAIYNMTLPAGVSDGDKVLFVFWAIFHVLGLIFQTLFLIRASNIGTLNYNSNKYVFLRALLWFLAISNLEMFFENCFLPQRVMKHVANLSSEKSLIESSYNIVRRVLYPGTSLYRLQSCLLCLEDLRNIKAEKDLTATK